MDEEIKMNQNQELYDPFGENDLEADGHNDIIYDPLKSEEKEKH